MFYVVAVMVGGWIDLCLIKGRSSVPLCAASKRALEVLCVCVCTCVYLCALVCKGASNAVSIALLAKCNSYRGLNHFESIEFDAQFTTTMCYVASYVSDRRSPNYTASNIFCAVLSI